jgi:hypothetical protein
MCDFAGGEQPLQFRPVPENLVSKSAGQSDRVSDQDEDGDITEKQSSTVYVPPRVVAMPYKEESRRVPKSRAEKSRLMTELRDELTDFPTEVKVST